MTVDASNRKSIRLAEKSAAIREETKVNFLVAAMSTDAGRLFFHDLLADCGVGVVNPSFDPHRDYFTQGQRSVGLHYMAQIQTHCPDQYIQMMRDEHVRIAAAAERSRLSDPGRDDSGHTGSDPDAEPQPFDPYGPETE